MTRLIDADALIEDFRTRATKARQWKESAILANNAEAVTRADATLAFLTEVKLTIENAPTVTPIDETFSTAIDKYGDNTFSVIVISSKGEKIEFNRVEKGKWKPILEENGTPYWEENYEPMFLCTRCKCKSYKKPFCPHCGADMREGDT